MHILPTGLYSTVWLPRYHPWLLQLSIILTFPLSKPLIDFASHSEWKSQFFLWSNHMVWPNFSALYHSQLPTSAPATMASLQFPKPLEHIPTQDLLPPLSTHPLHWILSPSHLFTEALSTSPLNLPLCPSILYLQANSFPFKALSFKVIAWNYIKYLLSKLVYDLFFPRECKLHKGRHFAMTTAVPLS